MRLLTPILIAFAIQTSANTPSRAVPEAFTGLNFQKAAYGDQAMVSAANPHAVNAGIEMLKLGGSAADAAIAVQLVLTLVEPQSSGIGGGAFMLWYDGKEKALTSYDGRETAPASANSDLFLDKSGKPIRWIDAVIGGHSVGVPGLMKMLADVHEKEGKLPWSRLFQPAIKLAQQGFIVSPRLAKLVAMKMNPGLAKLSPAKEYFYPNGVAIREGQLLKNPEYANTLKAIAKEGAQAFYQGQIAQDIVNAVQNADIAPGRLSLEDMANYQAKVRTPVCIEYQGEAGDFDVCSMGPPSSGGITVLQILKLLEPYQLTKSPVDSVETVHLYTQAAKLAFADRDHYIADSDFVPVPVQDMLQPEYLRHRRKQISLTQDLGIAKPGQIGSSMLAANDSIAQPNTSHFSIMDAFGNAVSMTSSIEMGFGSTVFTNGFLLNNQLTDFSLQPKRNGHWVANRVEGSKRPRSSMTPVIVFKDDEVYAVLGSPGGSRIINYVGYALVGLLDYGLDMQTVTELARVSNRNGYTGLESGTKLESIKQALERKGHKVKLTNMTSGIHGILKTKRGWQGAADPRREGTAIGI